jgi:predicted metalloprotease with PDZ domain
MTFTFEDVARALNNVVADDWPDYLRTRLDTHQNTTIDAALADTGWHLIFRDTPSVFLLRAQEANEIVDRTFSIGLALDKEAKISQVIWDGPAFKAGLTLGTAVVAVNGRAYKVDLLDQAIRDAQDPAKPVELLVRDLDRYRTVKLDYTGGPRYPDLARTTGTPDRLADILRPRT